MTSRHLLHITTALLAVVSGSQSAHAAIRLPNLLASHMVLQRELPIHLWGWSDPGESVTVSLNGVSVTAAGDRTGHWNAYLPPQPAGGPFQITVKGSNTLTLDDVMIGDVWFASGQSNMEMPMKGFPGSAVLKNGAEEIRQADHSNMRLLIVRKKSSEYPAEDLELDEPWSVCTPATVTDFSAVAYFFGRHISDEQHVAIGLIDSTWGGTPAEAWTSLDGIAADASLMPVFAARAEMTDQQAATASTIAAERREDAAARQAGRPLPTHPWHPDPSSWAPAGLYNGMVAPAIGLAIKGVIWYQGESNSEPMRAPLYEKLFPTMITDWRTKWQEGDFPFLFVQIANYNASPTEQWPTVREAQRRTLKLRNTGMAVTIDVGEPANIHPADKQTVGMRLGLAADSLAYGKSTDYVGPMFRQVTTAGSECRVWFDYAQGLTSKSAAVPGFQVAGNDRHFVNAQARIDGLTVVLSNAAVPAPKYVRYGWENAPVLDLFNASGLPASPFTSEDAIPTN